MSGRPARLDALIGVLDRLGDASTRTALRMHDGSDGPARSVFTPSGKPRRVARRSRWLAIARPGIGPAADAQGFDWLCGQVEELLRAVEPEPVA